MVPDGVATVPVDPILQLTPDSAATHRVEATASIPGLLLVVIPELMASVGGEMARARYSCVCVGGGGGGGGGGCTMCVAGGSPIGGP